jgi:hypothetical protein
VLAQFLTFIFYTAVVGEKKHFYLGPSIIFFTVDIKMWTIHSDMLEVFVILKLKKYQGDVLEQNIQLCPFCYFPVIIAGKEEANLICKFLGYHTSIVCWFPFFADT